MLEDEYLIKPSEIIQITHFTHLNMFNPLTHTK